MKMMHRKELNTKRLVREANAKAMQVNTRRHLLKESAMGLGALALAALLPGCMSGTQGGVVDTSSTVFDPANPLAPKLPMCPGKAKSVIYLHMAGAPSQLELFASKPELIKLNVQNCTDSLLTGKPLPFIKRVPKILEPKPNLA